MIVSFLAFPSFYPLFPAPLPSKGIDALNLDMTHNDLVRMGASGADIIIVPSLLKHFIKVLASASSFHSYSDSL